MSDSLRRIVAIVRADFLLRFRRPSTLIVFLLLSAFAYVWIPAPSTGRALIQIDGHRAIYNSGAIGMGTASLGMMFVGLFGYYVISNAIRRDIVSRCGVIAASTPMRSGEYLLGKFFGNLAFLTVFLAGFMLSSMAMLMVRGEARIEPLIFVQQYLLLTPAAIIFVSAVAVLFESIPLLSGKLGDVFYFFFWMTFMGLAIGDQVSGGRMQWARCLDFSGFGFMIDQMTRTLQTDSVSIGASSFDPTKAPILFPGLRMQREWIVPRIVSMLLPLLFLPLAGLFFHRFDPARTRRTSDKSNRKWIGKIQNLFKPLSRRAVALLMTLGRGHSLPAAIWGDAILTLTLSPLALVAFVGITIATVSGAALDGLLPIVFAVLAILLSDIATRDRRAGTTAILYAAPRLREHFVWWKLGSALVLGLLLCAAPIARIAWHGLPSIVSLLVGIFFVVALATALGVITANAKTFIVLFLSFWYVVVNDRGATAMLNFAGIYGPAAPGTTLTYAALAATVLLIAQSIYRARLARV